MDPAGSRVTVRDAVTSDVPALERIENASFHTDLMSRRSLLQHVASRTADVLAAELDGHVCGYALVFHRRGSPVARLYSIATDASARGRGVASALLRAAEEACLRRGSGVLRLEVREDNAAAIQLYIRHGFEPFGRRETYYEDGAPALRFQKRLAPSGARAA